MTPFDEYIPSIAEGLRACGPFDKLPMNRRFRHARERGCRNAKTPFDRLRVSGLDLLETKRVPLMLTRSRSIMQSPSTALRMYLSKHRVGVFQTGYWWLDRPIFAGRFSVPPMFE